MGHPNDGVLRRSLDEPFAASDADRMHLASCARCAELLQTVVRDRDLARVALSGGRPAEADLGIDRAGQRAVDGGVDGGVDRAWAALAVRLADRPVDRPVRRAGRRWARRPVAVAVTAGLVLVGGTAAAAAANWLPIFRTEKVAPVAISAQDLTSATLGQLAGLSAYGDLTQPDGSGLTDVPDAAAAASTSGVAVPEVGALPTGVSGRPAYHVVATQTVSFRFSAAKAAKAAAAAGAVLAPMPAGLDGSRLRVDVGPGVVEDWQQPTGMQTLIVARVKAPTASTEGAALPVVRDYLLSLPGIPPALAAQLKVITGDGSTLPIPVPAGMATASQSTVGGATATVLEVTGGAGAAVVWVAGGQLNAVLGPLSRDEVLAVARGLH